MGRTWRRAVGDHERGEQVKTWKRNGVTLEFHQQPDGWWQAAVTDADGEVADAAICQSPFVLLRALARCFRRLALAAALVALALGCETTPEVRPYNPARCFNEVAWNGWAWATLPETWVADSFCQPEHFPKPVPTARCAATDTMDAHGYGEVSHRWTANCGTSKGKE